MDIKNFSVKFVNINGLQKSLTNPKHILPTIAYFVVMLSHKNDNCPKWVNQSSLSIFLSIVMLKLPSKFYEGSSNNTMVKNLL
ncbi:hypothetical protein BBF96_13785 [Anoxybacter fermentans]|uniref:Uncharacterized protein n=1 Tax=Anoxybacter fermentans TaxID=1323375 RepID=A0A3Q9HRX5_9FIRM|nr:hypothetical protein BBF96_13785 [Anoxybacter fermentans]